MKPIRPVTNRVVLLTRDLKHIKKYTPSQIERAGSQEVLQSIQSTRRALAASELGKIGNKAALELLKSQYKKEQDHKV
ncbi:MAG: hypothetical protein Q7K42_03405, partial [Candidatus Diapherotrites archaeon]|nr:hypothetical protein [Candidatus Diapherotrites archaeon]